MVFRSCFRSLDAYVFRAYLVVVDSQFFAPDNLLCLGALNDFVRQFLKTQMKLEK